MERPSTQIAFSLDDLNQSARAILRADPDEIIVYRLLREVLRVPAIDPELEAVKQAALGSNWVRQLVDSQLQDGSWGRFHSQNTKIKTVFRTTEEAIDRAFALGLEPDEGPLARTRQYIQGVLLGNAQITDRDEKNESWPLLIRFILAGRLAQLDPTNKLLSLFWIYLEEVAERSFTSGNYRLDDEAAAYSALSGTHVPQGFLESQHALWILSAHRLPGHLDHAIVNWIWHKSDGIRYLRAPLAEPAPRQIWYWFRSMNILSRFSSWRETCMDTLNRLWCQSDKDGLWDFGVDIARCANFPLSNNWRKPINRRLDYSTCILVLLRKWFD